LYISKERNKMFRGNPEFTHRGEVADDLETPEGAEVEDIITGVHQEILSAADLTPSNGNALNEIFDLARATYDKDAKAWDQLFETLSVELANASDDDDAADILDQHRRKATSIA